MSAVANGTLQRAASLWFLTAVAGQWLFVYYISAFYGPTDRCSSCRRFARARARSIDGMDGYS